MKCKVLIFGTTGMLGNCAFKNLSKYIDNLEIVGIVRSKNDKNKFSLDKFHRIHIFKNFRKVNEISKLINSYKPNIILNCLGLIKQKLNIPSDDFIYFNSIFPKMLESICKDKVKIINISTDCVFSGKNGNYDENSLDLATDIYGVSKYLGEIYSYNNLTIRTSIIGHEIKNNISLLEWFLKNKEKKIYGFSNAFFSGLTTLELIKIISKIIIKHFNLNGIYHVSSKKISKFELLNLINSEYSLNKNIIEKKNRFIDRSLNSTKFKNITKIKVSSWKKMIKEMKNNHV